MKKSMSYVLLLSVSLLVTGCSWFSAADETAEAPASTLTVEPHQGAMNRHHHGKGRAAKVDKETVTETVSSQDASAKPDELRSSAAKSRPVRHRVAKHKRHPQAKKTVIKAQAPKDAEISIDTADSSNDQTSVTSSAE